MKKKLTKTIGLIVFVMFINIFITNVNAVSGDVALTCVYDDKETIVLNITNSGSIFKSNSCTFGGGIYNWNKANKGGFVGRDYYLEHNECPPNVVYDEDLIGYDVVYLAGSESNAEKIKGEIFAGARIAKLKPISQVAQKLNIPEKYTDLYGKNKAKINNNFFMLVSLLYLFGSSGVQTIPMPPNN